MAVKEKVVEKVEEKKSPDFNVRARSAPGSEFYVNLGVAWKTKVGGIP